MFFLTPRTTCFSSKRLWCHLNKTSCGTRSLFTQRNRRVTRHRYLNLPSDDRDVRILGAVSMESEKTPVHEKNASSFDWFKNWWMVQAVFNLETDRPNKIKLLNRDFIVWKGHSGEWIAMDDECPHRLAPLSEGRIEKDGNLLCSYHAWRFDETGKCVKIPHAEDEKAHTVACNSPRSAVQTYPCKERGSLLWIWPDKSASAFSEAENSSIPIEDDLADYLERVHEEGVFVPFVRQLPMGFDTLIENIFDATHFHSAHHGVIPGCSRDEASPIHARFSKQVSSGRETFSVKYNDPPYMREGIVKLETPGTCAYDKLNVEGDSVETTYLSCSPVSKNQSLAVFVLVQESQISSKRKSNFIERALSPFLNLFYHLFSMEVGDSDIVLVLNQDWKTKEEGFEAEKGFYLATNADLGVLAWRRWFEKAGQRGVAYGGNEPIDPNVRLSREQALNRFEQHTKHCKLCRSALKTAEAVISVLKFVRLAAAFAGGAFLLKATSTGSVPLSSILKNVPFIVAVFVLSCSIAAIHMLNKLRSQFNYVGYDFTEKN